MHKIHRGRGIILTTTESFQKVLLHVFFPHVFMVKG